MMHPPFTDYTVFTVITHTHKQTSTLETNTGLLAYVPVPCPLSCCVGDSWRTVERMRKCTFCNCASNCIDNLFNNVNTEYTKTLKNNRTFQSTVAIAALKIMSRSKPCVFPQSLFTVIIASLRKVSKNSCKKVVLVFADIWEVLIKRRQGLFKGSINWIKNNTTVKSKISSIL